MNHVRWYVIACSKLLTVLVILTDHFGKYLKGRFLASTQLYPQFIIYCPVIFEENHSILQLTGYHKHCPIPQQCNILSTLVTKKITMPKTLLAEWGKLGSCSACPIAIFLPNSLATCKKASGYVAHWAHDMVKYFYVLPILPKWNHFEIILGKEQFTYFLVCIPTCCCLPYRPVWLDKHSNTAQWCL